MNEPPRPPPLLSTTTTALLQKHFNHHQSCLPRTARAEVALPSRLRRALGRWRRITRDPRIIELVRSGLRFHMSGEPVGPRRPPVFVGSADQMTALRDQLHDWLREGVIEAGTDARALYGLLFPVAKPGPKRWRFVLDSRRLNAKLTDQPFKMETTEIAARLIRPGDYLTSIDLTDAFLHVPVNRAHRRLLAFQALGRSFWFRAMSFGTKTAPATFTRLLRPVLAQLRREQIRVSAYIDDILIVAESAEASTRATNRALQLLEQLGFTVNKTKSQLTPTQSLQHLGLIFDSTECRLFAPSDKLRAVARTARSVLRRHHDASLTVRQLSRLTGAITALMPALYDARRRRHALQRNVEYGLRVSNVNWDAPVALSRTALRDAFWWSDARRVGRRNGAPMLPRPPAFTLTTDASEFGYGATLQFDNEMHDFRGRWSPDEASRSSNWRESTATARAYQHFKRHLKRHASLLIRTDNTTTLSTLRRFGSRHKHLDEALAPLLHSVIKRQIDMRAEHIAGTDNYIADRLSRAINKHNEWRLAPWALQHIRRTFNIDFTIDWLASASTAQCARYGTADVYDRQAAVQNALRVAWRDETGLVVPPFNLIFRVLNKLALEPHAHGVMVVPSWPSAPWAPLIPWRRRSHILELPPAALVTADGARNPMRDGRSPPLIAFRF